MNPATLIENIKTACACEVSEASFQQLLRDSLDVLSWSTVGAARKLKVTRYTMHRWIKGFNCALRHDRRPILKYLAKNIACQYRLPDKLVDWT